MESTFSEERGTLSNTDGETLRSRLNDVPLHLRVRAPLVYWKCFVFTLTLNQTTGSQDSLYTLQLVLQDHLLKLFTKERRRQEIISLRP